MASNSRQRSSSSGRSPRKKVVITGDKTTGGTKRKARNAKSKSSTGVKRSAAATRASDKRRDDREKRLRRQKRAQRVRIGAIAFAVVAVLAGGMALIQSSAFSVAEIEVLGNETLTAERVIEIAAVPPGTTLLRFGASDVKVRLEADPWIAEATVTRDFPDTMRIRVVERSPVAYVDLGGETYWAVDSLGFFLAEETPDASSTLVVIRDIEGLEPELGTRSDSDSLKNALTVYDGLSEELGSSVRAISASSVDKTTLITHTDIEILIGSAEDIQMKDQVARQILEERAGTVLYVNVRTVDRPTWRGIGE